MDAQKVKASFGIQGGGIVTMMKTIPEPSSPYIHGYGGVHFTMKFWNTIGFQVETNYAFSGANFDKSESTTFPTISNNSIKLEQTYIQVPITLQLHLGRVFILEGGYMQSIMQSAKFTESGQQELIIDPDLAQAKYFGSLVGGLMINFSQSVYLNARYIQSLGNTYSFNGAMVKNTMITVGLGIRIFQTKKHAF